MIQIRDLSNDLDFMYSKTKFAEGLVPKPFHPRFKQSYRLIKAILENFWIEGEPGHEEHYIHPRAFGDEEDVRI